MGLIYQLDRREGRGGDRAPMAKQRAFRKDKWPFKETNVSMTVCDDGCLCNFLSRSEWFIFSLAVELPPRGFMAA